MAALQFFGLDRTATVTDVNRAFRKLATKAHPDHGGDAGAFKILQAQHELARLAVTK
jgi:DnaJ-class molecular chaperone